MKNYFLAIALSAVLIGCADKKEPAAKAVTPDLGAGKAIAERSCKTCHGLDGKGVAPAIPHLAAQRERYLLASLMEYKEGKRTHAALRDMTANMSEADMRNIAGYYASQPPIVNATATDVKHSSPYDQGQKLSTACAKCHGEDGNSKTSGTPTSRLYFAHFNFCRRHATLYVKGQGGRTPAMAAGLSNHVWTMAELLAIIGST